MCDNLGVVHMAGNRLQNAIKSCNLKLSRPEVLLTFFELLCWRWQYVLQAASDLSANWN